MFVLCLSLGSHLSPNGTECYITSDMFYVEVQLDPTGLLCDVKVAHHGENPVVRVADEEEGSALVGLEPPVESKTPMSGAFSRVNP